MFALFFAIKREPWGAAWQWQTEETRADSLPSCGASGCVLREVKQLLASLPSFPMGLKQSVAHYSVNSSSSLTCASSVLPCVSPACLMYSDPKTFFMSLVCFFHKIGTLHTNKCTCSDIASPVVSVYAFSAFPQHRFTWRRNSKWDPTRGSSKAQSVPYPWIFSGVKEMWNMNLDDNRKGIQYASPWVRFFNISFFI